MDCSLPGSSVHGVLQARILEWVAVPFSRGSSRPRDLNPGLLHCRQILSRLSHQGSPEHIKLCPDVSSELTRGLVLRVGRTGDTAKEVVRCCGPVGEEGDAFARMMARQRTEHGRPRPSSSVDRRSQGWTLPVETAQALLYFTQTNTRTCSVCVCVW